MVIVCASTIFSWFLKQSIINLSSRKNINTLAIEKIIFPRTKINIPIRIQKYSLPMLNTRKWTALFIFLLMKYLSDVFSLIRKVYLHMIFQSHDSIDVILLFLFINYENRLLCHRTMLLIRWKLPGRTTFCLVSSTLLISWLL